LVALILDPEVKPRADIVLGLGLIEEFEGELGKGVFGNAEELEERGVDGE
jgi:hypothetical protein